MTTRSSAALAAVASLLFLAACGGGGSGGGGPSVSAPPVPQPQPQPPATGGQTSGTPPVQPQPPAPTPQPPQPPAPSFDQATRTTLERLIRSSDTVTDASTIDGEPFGWTPTAQPTPVSLRLADITKNDHDAFRSAGARKAMTESIDNRGLVSALDYAGWFDHSFFMVGVWNPVGRDPLRPSESTFTDAYSIGAASGSNPTSGGATWTGSMAGIDENEGAATFGNLVTGAATVSIPSFAQPAVDIALTGIADASTGKRHGDIRWNGVSLSGGAFSSGTLSGHFYGPNHEEVGGIFLRNQISGAFGASR